MAPKTYGKFFSTIYPAMIDERKKVMERKKKESEMLLKRLDDNIKMFMDLENENSTPPKLNENLDFAKALHKEKEEYDFEF